MIEFGTASGSLYQVDEDNCRVRRVCGTHPPTPSQGPEGVWKDYAAISDVKPGRCVFIVWGAGSTKYTQTSFVTVVREVAVVDA